MRRTKIICTLGPAEAEDDVLRDLMLNGMDCARCNFSHGTHAEHKVMIDRVKRIRDELNKQIAILLDTKGPEIRVAAFKEGEIFLEEGEKFILDTKKELPGDKTRVGITYGDLAKHIKPGTRILIDDGKIELLLEETDGDDLICKVVNGGRVSNHKSINIPHTSIPMEYISPVDRSDILFGIEQGVDFIAASFVRSADDVRKLRALLIENGGETIKIISKIENGEGIQNFDEILEETDGVMVARGDLGVEVSFAEIPALQKMIIEKCFKAGKIVITATQMLESMITSPRPTRAEVSDVANAVYDGTSAIMLSGETAAGAYPIEAVRTMAKIAETSENFIDLKKHAIRKRSQLNRNIMDAICTGACDAAEYLDAKAIVNVTRSGITSFELSCFRPECPIIAAAVDERGCRQLSLAWGVRQVPACEQTSVDELLEYAKEKALETGLVERGDTIVIVIGSALNKATICDTIRICVL